MNRRQLEMALERVEVFRNPSPELEQYVTPAEIASHILHVAYMNAEIEGRNVVDLGCGTGVLTIGASLLNGRSVGVDIDFEALKKARKNARELGVESNFICSDVEHFCLDSDLPVTVVMNPPFGAQKQNVGADRKFLEKAEEFAEVAYTVHNSGSRDFVEDFVNGEITHAFEASFMLPHQFEFHEEEEREISVEVYRILFSDDE